MKVSVIVPVYNVESYLRRCLDSLIVQDFPRADYEIIVVNDGSTDGSIYIANEFQAGNKDLIKVFTKKNGGLSDARNFGLHAASGDYIAFVDSDDYVEPVFISRLYECAITEQSDIVVCAYLAEDERTGKIALRQRGGMRHFNMSAQDNPRMLTVNSPYAWNKLYRKELFDNTGFYFPFGLPYEDIATVYPLLAFSKKVSKIEEPLVHYITNRKGSITGTFNSQKLNVLSSLGIMLDRFAEMGNHDVFVNELFLICSRHIFYRLRELDKYSNAKERAAFVEESFAFLDSRFPNWFMDEAKSNILKSEKIVLDRKRGASYLSAASLPIRVAVKRRVKKISGKAKSLLSRGKQSRYLYACFRSMTRINPRVALFESFHGREVSDSPLVLANAFVSKYNDWKVFFAFSGSENEFRKVVGESSDFRYVKIRSVKYYYLLATARLLVNSVSFPDFFERRSGQLYLNTWHGTPLKTLGRSMKEGVEDLSNIQRNFLQSTHLFFPDQYTETRMMSDYMLSQLYSGYVCELAYPRNRVFLDGRSRDKENGGASEFTIAYMPTWRGATSHRVEDGSVQNVIDFLEYVDEALPANFKFVVKLHSLMMGTIDFSIFKRVEAFPTGLSSYDVLSGCDALITDYSSVMFDFALSGRPVYLLAWDKDEYCSERGMYLDLEDLPFAIFKSGEELLSAIVRDCKDADTTKRNDIYSAFYRDTLEAFPFVPEQDIFEVLLNDKEANWLRYHSATVDAGSSASVLICKNCYTESDFREVSLRADLLQSTILMIPSKSFSAALRNLIFEDSGETFDAFVVTRGKSSRTYFEALKEFFMSGEQKRAESRIRRVSRYLPGIEVGEIEVIDPFEMRQEA